MPFTTLPYIGFFAALFFAYYAIPKRFQWWLLLAGSMVFYGYSSPVYLLLLWVTILVTYVGTRGVTALYESRDAYLKANNATLDREAKKAYRAGVEKKAVWMMTGTVVFLLATLGVFKYAQFAIDNCFAAIGWFGVKLSSPTLDIILPVGLSFYAFQTIGYCVDVYREEVSAEKNLLKHALFVSYFPQILQGPIGRYGSLAPQLTSEHAFDYAQVKLGIQRVAWGVFKKLMIANAMAHKIDPVWTNVGDYTGFVCWMAILTGYAIQLYADFSGYMDIACGCSQMLGVRIDENFNLPYFAKNVPDFWRRWHMTLSSWFKDYLFYPLLRSDWNGNLRKKLFGNKYLSSVIPTSLALLVVWFATGLWHGASWGYVAWGLYYGFFMILNMAIQPLCDRLHAAFPRLTGSKAYALMQMLRTFFIVCIGYGLFKPADLSASCALFSSMCHWSGEGLRSLRLFVTDALPMWAGLLAMLAVDVVHYWKGDGVLRGWIAKRGWVIRVAIYVIALFCVINFGVFGDRYNQFEYFKF